MLRNSKDCISALALIALAATLHFYLIPNHVTEIASEDGAMSPRFFPSIGAALVGFGGLALLLVTLGSKAAARAPQTAEEKGDVRRAAMVALALACFVLLFELAGYLVAAPLLVAVLMAIFGSRNPFAIALVSVVTAGALYILFSYGLNLTLE